MRLCHGSDRFVFLVNVVLILLGNLLYFGFVYYNSFTFSASFVYYQLSRFVVFAQAYFFLLSLSSLFKTCLSDPGVFIFLTERLSRVTPLILLPLMRRFREICDFLIECRYPQNKWKLTELLVSWSTVILVNFIGRQGFISYKSKVLSLQLLWRMCRAIWSSLSMGKQCKIFQWP